MSIYLQGGLWIGGACLASAVLLILVNRLGDRTRREPNNDVNGLMFAIVGVLYAIVVGFVVTSQWEAVSDARDASAQEAHGVIRLYWAADALPADRQTRVRELCRDYAVEVRDTEWPAMLADRDVGTGGARLLNRLNAAAQPPADLSDTQAEQLSDALDGILQGRQQRLGLVHRDLSGMMWFVLIAGGVLTVAMAYLFGVPGHRAHLVMIVSLVGTLGLLLYACYQLQYPFGPATHLQPTQISAVVRLVDASPGG